nr:RecName: Full=RNA-directed RNA polymerase beta chain; AltName: Full=RNA replicase beta chain [Enterobacteria phage JP34]
MFRFTEIEKTLCMDRTRDCAVRFHVYLQSLDLGSSDPHSPDFDGLAYLRDECLTKHPSLGDSNSDARRKELAYAKLMDSDQRCKIQNSNGYDYSHIESGV